jgi:hypothetical protein
MSNQFFVGQRVTMIKDVGHWVTGPEDVGLLMPEFGVVYIIRELYMGASELFLRFKELRNEKVAHLEGVEEPAFAANVFRPLVERKNDTEAFIKALDIQYFDERVLS